MKKLILSYILFFIIFSLSAVNLSIWVGPDQNYWEASWNLKIMETGNWYYANNQTFNEAWSGYTRTYTLTPGSFRLYYWDSGGDGGLAGDIWSYGWNVSSWDHDESTGSSGYFSFIIPYLEVEEPNGNDELVIGESFEIEWDSNFLEGSDYEDDININLIKDDDFYLSIAVSYNNDGDYDWIIPNVISPDDDYQIEIVSETYDDIIDWSNYCFTIISSDYIEVTIPNGGQNWQAGSTQTISWEDNISENVTIQLIKNELWDSEIMNSTQSNGSYVWEIPIDLQPDNDYKVEIQSISNSSVEDWSDYCFTITAPTLPNFIYRNGNEFMLNGEIFNFVGTNCYYLMDIQARDSYHQSKVDEVLDLAENTGINVIRSWGFNDDPSDQSVLQISPGVYNANTWAALDSIIFKANQSNIKLILPLVNYNDDYGGMKQYIEWFNDINNPNYSLESGYQEYFYSDPIIKDWFKSYLDSVITRVNHITNIQYKDDPTIMAWELANEPRDEPQGNINLLTDWIVEMTQHIKSIDSNHIVGIGSESNYWGNTSIDYFISINDIEIVDFITLHLYVDSDHLGLNSIQEVEEFVSERINTSHSDLNKPIILEEFGFDRNFIDSYGYDRRDYYQAIYNQINLDSGNGSNFWVLFPDDFEDWDDGKGVYSYDTDLLDIISSSGNVSIDENNVILQSNISNFQNYPNPFNPTTTIEFSIHYDLKVKLQIFNIKGQLLKTLCDDEFTKGTYSIIWYGEDDFDNSVSSGIYLFKLKLNGKTEAMKKCLLLK